MYGRKYESTLTKFFKVIAVVICVSLFIYGCVCVANLFKPRDAYKEVKMSYSVGEIVSDSTGDGVSTTECKTALFSNNKVTCTGFYITASFKTRFDYEIHFYTKNDVYVGYVQTSDIQYVVDVGDMPVLKSTVGNIDSADYKNAEAVLDKDGNEQVAAYIRIVIRPIEADEDIFTNAAGWSTKNQFAGSLTVKATTKLPRS